VSHCHCLGHFFWPNRAAIPSFSSSSADSKGAKGFYVRPNRGLFAFLVARPATYGRESRSPLPTPGYIKNDLLYGGSPFMTSRKLHFMSHGGGLFVLSSASSLFTFTLTFTFANGSTSLLAFGTRTFIRLYIC